MTQEKESSQSLSLYYNIKFQREQRKAEERLKKIRGLEKRVQQLESLLANRLLDKEKLQCDIERAVQRALSNVRMIPVLPFEDSYFKSEVQTYKESLQKGEQEA